MKKIIIAVALAAITTPVAAQGMTYYLVSQWSRNGSQFCQYSNGTVLNVGVRICPLSIRG